MEELEERFIEDLKIFRAEEKDYVGETFKREYESKVVMFLTRT